MNSGFARLSYKVKREEWVRSKEIERNGIMKGETNKSKQHSTVGV